MIIHMIMIDVVKASKKRSNAIIQRFDAVNKVNARKSLN